MRKKVYKVSDALVEEAVKASFSINGVLKYLGLNMYGSSHFTMKNRIKDLNLDTSHFTGKLWNKGKKLGYKKVDLSTLLVENSRRIITSLMKRKLIRLNFLKEACAICGLIPVWNNSPLVLQIDHVNGVKSDNRLENLRLLCPNCHSQTHTFAGKNTIKNPEVVELLDTSVSKTDSLKGVKVGILSSGPSLKEKKAFFCSCGNKVTKKGLRCLDCYHSSLKKIDWPSKEELSLLVRSYPSSVLAKQLGVSDSAIGKRCRILGIEKPGRGYWAKLSA